MPKNKEKPIYTIRAGATCVSIWERNGKDRPFYSANVNRAYTEDDGKTWKYSDSFTRDDLLTAAKLLDLAHTWILRKESENKKTEGE